MTRLNFAMTAAAGQTQTDRHPWNLQRQARTAHSSLHPSSSRDWNASCTLSSNASKDFIIFWCLHLSDVSKLTLHSVIWNMEPILIQFEVFHSALVGRFHCRFPRWISAKNTVFRANQGRLWLPAADALVLNAGCPFDFARRI